MTITRPFCSRSDHHSFARHTSSLLISAAGVALACGCGDNPLEELPGGGGGTPTFTSIYNADAFQECKECHAPGAPGRTQDIEATQDWSTRDRALTTLRGTASGLMGNQADCNGVPLLGGSADESLLVASLDEDVRRNFSLPNFPDCVGDAISNQTAKIMADLPDSVLDDLKDWINAGAPGN